MRSAAVVLGVAVLAGTVLSAGCGKKTEGVAIGEAAPVGFPAPSGRFLDGDTTYVDSSDAAADSLAGDSSAVVRADTVVAAPDFAAFWPAVQAAVRSGRRADLAALALVGQGGIAPDAWPAASDAVLDAPVREALSALSARDVLAEGEARVARVVVGRDAAGAAVPQDEAVTDSALRLRFETVGGPWRLVRVTAER